MSVATSYQNYSPDWWTPPEWLRWVAGTLQTAVWFDPCPATWKSDDPCGLEVAWNRHTYCNHPGSRNSAAVWWRKYNREQSELRGEMLFVWCAFSVEQLRHLDPSPFYLPGWLVMPRSRTAFVWGGPTDGGREHGEPCKSPANWAVWWTTAPPATPPAESVIVRTA